MTLKHTHTHDCIGRCLHRIVIPTQCSPPGQSPSYASNCWRTAAVKLFFNFTRSIIASLAFHMPDIQIIVPNTADLFRGVVICKSGEIIEM